jgi:hypothetical protein
LKILLEFTETENFDRIQKIFCFFSLVGLSIYRTFIFNYLCIEDGQPHILIASQRTVLVALSVNRVIIEAERKCEIHVQSATEYRTNPVFGLAICVRLSNGPIFKQLSKTGRICPVFE